MTTPIGQNPDWGQRPTLTSNPETSQLFSSLSLASFAGGLLPPHHVAAGVRLRAVRPVLCAYAPGTVAVQEPRDSAGCGPHHLGRECTRQALYLQSKGGSRCEEREEVQCDKSKNNIKTIQRLCQNS